MGDGFYRVAGFAPGAQASGDDKDFEALLLEQVRHPGARGLACSSTVEINLPLLGDLLDFLLEVIGFEAD